MKYFSKFFLYWHTLHYLRLSQFYRRAWFIFYKPKLNYLKAIKIRDTQEKLKPFILKPISLISPNCFKFLNHIHTLPDQERWNNKSLEKLWIYNLHYFDDLNALNSDLRNVWHKELMHQWILENPLGEGIGWDPYPTSLRIVNWIKWALKGNELSSESLDSLCNQTRWLMNRLEWHLLGNHLFANAKALIFSGLFFDEKEAQKWLQKGLFIMNQEILEQILKDGGHFERSPMYHAIFLEDILDLINIMQIYRDSIDEKTLAMLKSYVFNMLNWLLGMTHPDGEISFFNDAAFKIAPKVENLIEYASRLNIFYQKPKNIFLPLKSKINFQYFEESGYINLATSSAVSILDVANIGPDYLPGHGHADTLSFELSVFDHRFIVNGGTSCYGDKKERLKERETSSHSTVEVCGENSSEVWGSFRVGRRAYPFNLEINNNPKSLKIACSHDGYQRLHKNLVHRRTWEMTENSLKVSDEVNPNLPAVARYIIHPLVYCSQIDEQIYELKLENEKVVYFISELGKVSVKPAQYSPEFGKRIDTQALIVNLIQGKSVSLFLWNEDAYSFLNR